MSLASSRKWERSKDLTSQEGREQPSSVLRRLKQGYQAVFSDKLRSVLIEVDYESSLFYKRIWFLGFL